MKSTHTALGAQGSGSENSDPDRAYFDALEIDPENLVTGAGEKRKSVKLPVRTIRAAEEIGEALGFPAEDIFNLTLHSVLAHVRRNNCLNAPFRIVAFGEFLIAPGAENAGRLEKAARALGVPYKDSAHLLVRLALDAIDAGDLRPVRMGAAAALLPRAENNPATDSPALPQVRPEHVRQLVEVAAMLEISPQDFLDWHIGPMLEDILNPGMGELRHWAEVNLEYDSEEQKARVITRVIAWSNRETRRRERRLKRALARRKPAAETGVAA